MQSRCCQSHAIVLACFLQGDRQLQHFATGADRLQACPETFGAAGNLYFMGYNVEATPFCWYSGLDPQGHILFDCPVPIPNGILMHDMQTTEDYAIIIDTNVEFDPQVWTGSYPTCMPSIAKSGSCNRLPCIMHACIERFQLPFQLLSVSPDAIPPQHASKYQHAAARLDVLKHPSACLHISSTSKLPQHLG